MTKKSRTILILSVVLTAGAAVGAVVINHYSEPNFAKMSPREVREYFDSNEFRDANEQTRRQVRQQMGEAMRARMDKQVNEYFAQPEETRTAYLDNIIDEMQTRRAEFMANRDANRPFDPNRFFDPNRPRDPNMFARGRQRVNPQEMRERTDGRSAEDRVKMMQFQRAMRDRMDQRGIQGPMGRGGFGGGRGFGGPGGGRGFGGPPD